MPNEMPNGQKLMGAIVYGVLGAAFAYQSLPAFSYQFIQLYLVPLSVGVGLWLGWTTIGRARHLGFATLLSHSVATIGCMVIVVLLLISGWRMIELSTMNRYDAFLEAMYDVLNLFVEFGTLILIQPVLITLGVGAVVGAVLVGFAGRHWS